MVHALRTYQMTRACLAMDAAITAPTSGADAPASLPAHATSATKLKSNNAASVRRRRRYWLGLPDRRRRLRRRRVAEYHAGRIVADVLEYPFGDGHRPVHVGQQRIKILQPRTCETLDPR